MRSRREKKADSFPAKPGSVSSVLAGARASLLHPSRPFTPADHSRPLFAGSDYNSRPTSAYNPVEFRQSVSKGDVLGSADFDLLRAEEDTTRPTSSHGQRSRGEAAAVAGVGAAAAGELQRGAASHGHGDHRSPEILQLPSAGAPPASGSAGGGSSAATVALVGELDLPGADLLALCGELWQHVTSAEFRDDQAAGLPVDKIVVDRLAKLAVEHGDDAPLLLATSRVLLQVISKRGPGLLSTCRMLFKLSKNERNDAAFHDAHIIEPLISLVIHEAAQMGTDTAAAVPKGKKRAVTSFDVLVYSIGTLKNISQQSQTNQKRMSQQGVFAAMAEVLSSAVKHQTDTVRADPQRPRYTDRQAQVLVQATATLRNMAVISAHRKQFVTFEIVDKLCRLAGSDGAVHHLELMLNVSRILSKLTLHEDCRAPMYNRSTIQSFVSLLEAHPTNLSLVLRVSFILGNLTTTSDDCRVLILETAGAVELLLDMLQQLCERSCGAGAPEDGSSQPQSQAVVTAGAEAEPEPELPQSGSDINATRQSQTDETLVKLIRLLANLAINGEVGLMVSQDRRCMLLVTVVESKPIADHEELVLNAVSAITNLSFYHQPLNAVLQHERVATLLVPLLLHDNHEAKLECARCYGNLSRFPEIRRTMKTHRVDEILLILLDHPRKEVLLAVCGVLMNLAADPLFRSVLRELHAVQKLMAVLEQLSLELSDLPLASMVCKTFFNCGLGSEEEVVMSIGEADNLIDMIRTLVEQCGEEDFAREVMEEGGSGGSDTLRVCIAVAQALAEQLEGRLQVADSPGRAPTDHSDLVPLPESHPEHIVPASDSSVGASASGEVHAARQQRLARMSSSEVSAPV